MDNNLALIQKSQIHKYCDCFLFLSGGGFQEHSELFSFVMNKDNANFVQIYME